MPLAEVEHLVEHHVGQAFDLGDAVADLADDADGLPGGRGLGARDLRFDFLHQVSHSHLTSDKSQPRFERRQPGPHAAVVDVAADLDPHAADERRVLRERRLQRPGRRRAPVRPGPRSRSWLGQAASALSTTARVPIAIEPHQPLEPRQDAAALPRRRGGGERAARPARARPRSSTPVHEAQAEQSPARCASSAWSTSSAFHRLQRKPLAVSSASRR